MKKDINLSTFFRPIANAFRKYSLTIFIVILVGSLATAVILLNGALQQASDTTGYTPTTSSTSFDQVTMNRVNQLHTSNEAAANYTPPSGRINPFSE